MWGASALFSGGMSRLPRGRAGRQEGWRLEWKGSARVDPGGERGGRGGWGLAGGSRRGAHPGPPRTKMTRQSCGASLSSAISPPRPNPLHCEGFAFGTLPRPSLPSSPSSGGSWCLMAGVGLLEVLRLKFWARDGRAGRILGRCDLRSGDRAAPAGEYIERLLFHKKNLGESISCGRHRGLNREGHSPPAAAPASGWGSAV